MEDLAEEYLGTTKLWAVDYEPLGWMFCHGQLLDIEQHSDLFSLLGTSYGGDGITRFALPDLRIRVALGNSDRMPLGRTGGASSVWLSTSEMPKHSHDVNAYGGKGTAVSPTNAYLAAQNNFTTIPSFDIRGYTIVPPNTSLGSTTILSEGGNMPHQNMQPYLALHYIICVNGKYPE
ncbi:MAG: phage tail protein [Bacteroidetes bacterium]|nr:MAG: phage tail protein [Bacteroidota bacterium]